jgi:hypothetical protein
MLFCTFTSKALLAPETAPVAEPAITIMGVTCNSCTTGFGNGMQPYAMRRPCAIQKLYLCAKGGG